MAKLEYIQKLSRLAQGKLDPLMTQAIKPKFADLTHL